MNKKTSRVDPSQLPSQLVKSAIQVMDSIELNQFIIIILLYDKKYKK